MRVLEETSVEKPAHILYNLSASELYIKAPVLEGVSSNSPENRARCADNSISPYLLCNMIENALLEDI